MSKEKAAEPQEGLYQSLLDGLHHLMADVQNEIDKIKKIIISNHEVKEGDRCLYWYDANDLKKKGLMEKQPYYGLIDKVEHNGEEIYYGILRWTKDWEEEHKRHKSLVFTDNKNVRILIQSQHPKMFKEFLDYYKDKEIEKNQ